jgi:3-phenylpropionate/trans-cinnamate dioxygenase ferredoxin reductase subunit
VPADADVLIVGGGLAAGNCARHLREAGFDGSIVLLGRELDPPYNRPPLSKGYLRGEESREDVLFRPADWWQEQRIDLRTRTSVLKLDPAAKVATLATKEELSFGQALVATGANVRRLTVDGCELDGIHYLRTLGNADAIRAAAGDADRVVLVGGSYIATELAASLTAVGKRCTILMQESVPLERGFGKTAGGFFGGVLSEHGVELVGEDELDRFEGEGRVQRVITKGGRELPADLVVMGVGAVPDVSLARQAGLELGEKGGVRTDAHLRTSAEGIFAAGDMAEYDSPIHGMPMRIEHWDVAMSQGRTAALNMAGQDVPHDVVPYFFSDLADWSSMEYVGPATSWDREVVRGSLEDGAFSLWYLDGGVVRAALSVGRSDDLEVARRLIKAGEPLERPEALGDPSADLAALIQ